MNSTILKHLTWAVTKLFYSNLLATGILLICFPHIILQMGWKWPVFLTINGIVVLWLRQLNNQNES